MFDCVLEVIDLFIVCLNIGLIYESIGDSYNIFMMLIVFFKSIFIFFFVLVYIFYAWKNWWYAKRRGAKANPNVVE